MGKLANKRKKQILQVDKGYYLYLFLLVIIPLVLNWKNIGYDFAPIDDKLIIKNNYDFLSDFKNVFNAFEKDNFISKDGKNYYRPVQTVSFMIDTQLGGEKADVYHLMNIFYHIITVIILFTLLRKLGVRDKISFYLSLLFSVHPLLTDTIVWIPGRGDLLAGLFCSVSFLSYVYFYTNKNKWFIVFHSAAFMLALFSKEVSVFLPVVIIFYYWVVLNNKYKIRELVPFLYSWGFIIGLYFFLRNTFLNYQNIISIKAYINNLPVIPIFFNKLILPIGLSPLPVYNVIYTIVGLILLLSLSFYIWKMRVGHKSLVLLGIVWFVGFIIPAMIVENPVSKVHFEYLECRSYLPSIGIFIGLGVLLNEMIMGKGLNILAKVFISIIIIFSVISYIYSRDFKDGMSFYSSLIRSNPDNAYAYSERGCLYMAANSFDLAFNDFDSAIKINPKASDPYFYKGAAYNMINDHINAERFLSIALKYDTLYPESSNLYENVFVNLSSEKLSLNKYDEAIGILKTGICKYPDKCSLHYNLGLAYSAQLKYDSAISEYNKAIETEKSIFTYYYHRGMAKYNLQDFAGAINDYNRTLELKPDFIDAWGNRGIAKVKLNDNEGAINDLTQVISIRQDLGVVWYFRGIAYSKLNRYKEAGEDWDKARELGYRDVINEK